MNASKKARVLGCVQVSLYWGRVRSFKFVRTGWIYALIERLHIYDAGEYENHEP